MSDKECIYREGAIAAVANYFGGTSRRAAIAAECILKPVPAAPVRKFATGRWLEHKHGTSAVYCSYCATVYEEANKFNYCPNCGADMRAEEGEA